MGVGGGSRIDGAKITAFMAGDSKQVPFIKISWTLFEKLGVGEGSSIDW